MESNDSPEIPDRGQTSDIPGFPSGDTHTSTREHINIQSITHTRARARAHRKVVFVNKLDVLKKKEKKRSFLSMLH